MGQDFSKADKGKTFKRGGEMATKMDPKMMAMMMAKKKAAMGSAPPAPPAPPMGGMGGGMGMKKGGMAKKMASGGLASGHKSADGIASKGKTKAKQITMCGGGSAKGKR